MPDTFETGEYKGHKVCKIYYGEFKKEPQYLILGLKKAQAVLENIDALRTWVNKQECPHGHNDHKNGGINPHGSADTEL